MVSSLVDEMKQQILIVEDEREINDMIAHHLELAGYGVRSAFDGDEAIRLLARHDLDLMIVDILLPGMDGRELCRQIRLGENRKYLPIIFLTALSSEAERIMGFELGCDDYLTKPFSPRELVSRVKAILRRENQKGKEATTIEIGNICIDFLKHQIRVKGKPIHLTNSEFRLLQLLVSNEGRVYSRDELLSLIRENKIDLELGNVDVHIHRLRQKLEENPKKPKFIQTVWGVGYRFSGSE